MFQTLLRFPLKTNGVTGICFDKLSRVFEGRNPAYNYQFLSSEHRDDWEYYRQDVLNEPAVWQTKGFDYFKTEINSVLIVDLPQEQDPTDRYPQPYFYWLNIEKVIDYEVDPVTGFMRYIMFYDQADNIAVFDKEHFEVYKFDRTKNLLGELISSNPHDLGYCPARFFWSDPLDLNEPDIKAHPITKELDSLDWYLFFHTSKKHLDLYGSYPIYSGYEQDCDYKEETTGLECDGGFLKTYGGYYDVNGAGLRKCPKCGDKRLAGPGTYIEIPIPGGQGDQEQPDLKNPVQMLGADVSTLGFNVSEENRLKELIIASIVGSDSELINDQAINEKQVNASFESQSTVLARIKKNFEAAQQFVDSTICRLRYGKTFVSAKVNLGTDFYTMTVTEMRERYKLAKDSGASEAELDAMQMQIIETEYRNNPGQMQRMLILSDLEPFKHLSRSEVMELYDKGLATKEQLQIKLNFPNFVRRFEREQINILEFATELDYKRKIEIIYKEFESYVSKD